MSIENRNQLAYFVVISREVDKCERCIDDLNELSGYHHDPEVLKKLDEVKQLLVDEINRLHWEMKEKKNEYFGPEDLSFLEDMFVDEEGKE